MLPLLDGARFCAPRRSNVSLIPLCAGHSGRHKASNVTLWSRSINRNQASCCKLHLPPAAADARQGAWSAHAHETDDQSLQQEYDQPMGAIDCEELEWTLAETVVH